VPGAHARLGSTRTMMFDLETVRVFAFMLAAPTIEMMRDRLRLDWPIQDGEPAPVKLTAMLFAPYGEPVTRNELLPRLEDFNAWSGRQIDVVWAGYGRYWGIFSPSDTVEVLEAGDEEAPWLYSPSFFNAFRAQIEADSRWRYGNRIDLLLTNASFDPATEQVRIELSGLVAIDLLAAQQDRAIVSVATFLVDLFRFAERGGGVDPVTDFLKAGLRRSLGRAVLDSALKVMQPRDVFVAGKHYRVC
jgi:hypothetical protein